MHLPARFLASTVVVAICLAAIGRAADPRGGLPISKVWPRSRPATLDLTPPALLSAPARPQLAAEPVPQRVDLNRASLEELQRLPGVGPALGAHLMAGRPYRTLGDLARDGLPFNTIDQIAPLITLEP